MALIYLSIMGSLGAASALATIIAAVVAVLTYIGFNPFKKQKGGEKEKINCKTYKAGDVSFNMIRVEGGKFKMGADKKDDDEAKKDESPAHEVSLSTFYIGETQVTWKLWDAVMQSNNDNNNPSSSDMRPVVNVSWNDCKAFIEKLNKLTNMKFRLPTEAEWEFAARGGQKSNNYKYAGSNTLDDVAWYRNNSEGKIHGVATTKHSNELGLYDMSGNVWEWCNDWYASKFYTNPRCLQPNPQGHQETGKHVIRGGSWNRVASRCRVTFRGGINPTRAQDNIGLRLALSE